jgi:hypothetical protein
LDQSFYFSGMVDTVRKRDSLALLAGKTKFWTPGPAVLLLYRSAKMRRSTTPHFDGSAVGESTAAQLTPATAKLARFGPFFVVYSITMSLDFHTVFSFLFMYDVSVLPIVKF